MTDIAIRVQNPCPERSRRICKQYPFGTFGRAGCIGAPQARYRTLRDTLTDAFTALGLLVSGAFYFRRMEKTFADVV